MRSFKKFITEGGGPGVGTTDQNLAVDFNINPSAVQEPEIVKKLNAFIGAVANAEFILPEHGIDKIRRSLSRVGFSFGAWIGFQTLMRRPEVDGLILIAPPVNLYDFNFLAPCPASGLIVQGKKDDLVPPEETTRLAEKLKSQKNITVDYEEITGANHFYDNETDKLEKTVRSYIERELNSKYR